MDLTPFNDLKYFGINVSAVSNDGGNLKKIVKAPLESCYIGTKHYFKEIYDKVSKSYIVPNGIAIVTKNLSTIDIDDVSKCDILENLKKDCNLIVKTRKGYHFYFNKENVLERNKLCDIADINLNTLYFVPKYVNIDTNEEYGYSIYKNLGNLGDMPQYAIDWCNKIIKEKYGIKKVRKIKTQQKVNDSEEEICSNTPEKSNDFLYNILNGLDISRFEKYSDWFTIGCVFINEGYDLNIFDKFSSKCNNYNKELNDKIIQNLKKDVNGYRVATLYYMLKKDNYELWLKLQKDRKDFWVFMETFNHFDIALVYYQLYPKKYIYSSNTWFILNEYNIYQKLHDNKDTLFNNITMIIQNLIIEQRNLINPSDDYYIQKNKLVKSNYNNIGNSSFKKGVIEALCGLYYIDNIESKLNDNLNLIAFDDKVFDIKVGEYRDIKSEDYISMTVGYKAPTLNIINKYRKDVEELLWSIFEDKEVIDYWLKTIGLSMFGNRSESLYIHSGSGRNGKGLLSNIIEKCLGSYYQQADSQLLTGDSKSATNSTLANAKNTRLLVLSEPDDTDYKSYKLKTSLVKSITGGDTITVRDLYKSNISFKPKFNVILQCNQKPDIDKLDIAIEQRLKVIHYPFTFVDNPLNDNERKINRFLKDKLSQNDEFIKSFIGILLEYAYKNSNCSNIIIPSKVKEQNSLYFDENNPVKDFLNDFCEITNDINDRIQTRELYLKYIEKNYKQISEIKFSDMMCNLNKIEKKKTKTFNYYLKIKFIDCKKDENNLDLN